MCVSGLVSARAYQMPRNVHEPPTGMRFQDKRWWLMRTLGIWYLLARAPTPRPSNNHTMKALHGCCWRTCSSRGEKDGGDLDRSAFVLLPPRHATAGSRDLATLVNERQRLVHQPGLSSGYKRFPLPFLLAFVQKPRNVSGGKEFVTSGTWTP